MPQRWKAIPRALCLLPLLAIAPVAMAVDWQYTVRPGDTLWGLSARYLRPELGWQRLSDYNHVANPHVLPPGGRLRMPVDWLRIEPVPATLLAVHGQVQARHGDAGAWADAAAGQALAAGAWLRTGNGASATIRFADGSQLLMREGSELQFDRLGRYGDTGMVDTRLRLQQGRSDSQVQPARGPASHYIIDTPTTTSSVRGTHFRIAAGSDGTPAITEVVGGTVQVRTPQREAAVIPGQAAVAGLDGVATLLPAPAIDQAGSRLDSPPLRLAWSAVAGASAYQVDVLDAADPLVAARSLHVDGTEAALEPLVAGRYQLRVRAVDAHGVQGWDSEPVPLAVAAGPAPPLALSPLQDATLYGPRPGFTWTENPDASATLLQVAATEDFAQPLQETQTGSHHLRVSTPLKPGRYYWRVASRGEGGALGSFGQPGRFTISDQPPDPAMQPPAQAHGVVTLRWQGTPGATRYHLQVARKGGFDHPRIDQWVDQPQVALPRLPPGRWQVRVQGVAADGVADDWSAPQQFRSPYPASLWVAGGALLLLAL